MRSILLLPLVARCLETIDVCISQIAFLRWSNVGSTLYTTMAHGWHTTLDQCSFDRWRMVG